jgi:hypothetical protein
MSCTEEEAKKKFCPHMRSFDANQSNIWQIQAKLHFTLCMASKCTQWREDTRFGEPGKRPGYCGLAGVPADAR